jgi:hypothetical protein
MTTCRFPTNLVHAMRLWWSGDRGYSSFTDSGRRCTLQDYEKALTGEGSRDFGDERHD